ncbi:MAG: hypothetical protein IJZ75_05485 [Clostridia bacterium]|nr:hypothetical protein [Clostridia bacterium]
MKTNTVIRIFAITLLAVFVLHQVYSSVYKPVVTESAEYFETVDGLKITGTIIRRESIVTCNTKGSLHFAVSDGMRVSKNGAVAYVYESDDASITLSSIEELNKQIEDIENMIAYNDLQAVDLDLVNSKVDKAVNGIVLGARGGNLTGIGGELNELLSAINRRQLITGEQTDFSEKLTSLKGQVEALEASLPTPKGNIKAAQSGYFVSGTDGYEAVFTCEDLSLITPEFLASAKPQKIPDNAIGKIVSDYEWYIAASVSLSDSLKYKEGDALTIKTSIKSHSNLSVTVEKINTSEENDTATVIFSCQQMSSELANLRSGSMTVVSKSYEGLKVSRRAQRIVDGQSGVYVLSGRSVKFVPINVLYKTDDYIICEQQVSNTSVLRLYDEVVVKGRNLYDGKIVG